MAGVGMQRLPGGKVPEAQRLIARAGYGLLPIGSEGDGADPGRMARQHLEAGPARQVPQPQRLVVGPRERLLPVGADRHRVDLVGMAGEHAHRLPALEVPQAQRLVAGAGQRVDAIGQRGHRPDRVGVAGQLGAVKAHLAPGTDQQFAHMRGGAWPHAAGQGDDARRGAAPGLIGHLAVEVAQGVGGRAARAVEARRADQAQQGRGVVVQHPPRGDAVYQRGQVVNLGVMARQQRRPRRGQVCQQQGAARRGVADRQPVERVKQATALVVAQREGGVRHGSILHSLSLGCKGLWAICRRDNPNVG